MNTNETTENFWEVWNSFAWPDIADPVYRCYYLDTGEVDIYTMEDLAGNYIEIDRAAYVAAAKPARVVEGKLVVDLPRVTVKKITPNSTTGTLCHPLDVAVVVASNGVYWNQKQNEIS